MMRRRVQVLGFALAVVLAAAPLLAAETLPKRLEGHGGPVKSVVLSGDGLQALTTSFDYSAIHWSLSENGAVVVSRLYGHEAAVNDIVFIDPQNAASVSDDGSLVLWDLPSGKPRKRITGTGDKILDIAVSPDGTKVAVASWDRTARVHDARTGAVLATMRGHRGNVNAVRFSGNGRHLHTASYDGTIRTWNAATGEFERRIADHGWAINVMETLPEGHLAYGLLDGTVFVVEPETGERLRELKKHDGPVLSLAVSASGRLIATGGGDGRIQVSDAVTGNSVEDFENPYGPVWALSFTPGEKALYYAGLDDFVSLWTVHPRQPFEAIDSVFPRRFQVGSDVELGEREFARKCSVCHTLEEDGKYRAGPSLMGLFGRRVGTLPGYPYSKALRDADFVWNDATIDKLFALGPHKFTPGSKMPLQRIRSDEKRSALIAYLRRVTDPDRQNSTDSGGETAPGKAAGKTKRETME